MSQPSTSIGTGGGGVGIATFFPQLSFSGGYGPASPIYLVTQVNGNSPCQTTIVNLSSGNNTITVPALAGGVIVFPPSGTSTAMTIKGINADTGVPCRSFFAIMFQASPPASFVINAASSITGVQIIFI